MTYLEIYIVTFFINIAILKILTKIEPSMFNLEDMGSVLFMNFVPGIQWFNTLCYGICLLLMILLLICQYIGKFIYGKDFEL